LLDAINNKENMKNFLDNYFEGIETISKLIDKSKINQAINTIHKLKKNAGRLFFLGVGGSAANASHAVNDFRKLCDIDAHSPLDNVSELTARTNDEGWDRVFIDYLKISKLNKNDALFILSVGGGNKSKNVSVNLIRALEYAKKNKTITMGIVGMDNGFTAKNADIVIKVPNINSSLITPYSESFQSVILHSIVSHEKLKIKSTKW
jgi:D-sedoheptulose 7-phosphate isomerase